MRSPSPLDPRTVLGAVKARPGIARARGEVIATAGLDRPSARRGQRCAGTGEGTAIGMNKGTTRDEGHAMT
jgi:hypothetical protein